RGGGMSASRLADAAFRDGGDGTRTRDLRRDRSAFIEVARHAGGSVRTFLACVRGRRSAAATRTASVPQESCPRYLRKALETGGSSALSLTAVTQSCKRSCNRGEGSAAQAADQRRPSRRRASGECVRLSAVGA